MKSADRRDAMNASRGAQCQVLTFSLGAECFGVDVLSVREIRGWTAVTTIPHAPAGVLGVLNLRGAIVPILDLRLRLNLPAAEVTSQTVIVVMSVGEPAGPTIFGLVVDAVADVIMLAEADVRPPPALASAGPANYVTGLGMVAGRMVILLNAAALADHGVTPLVPSARDAA